MTSSTPLATWERSTLEVIKHFWRKSSLEPSSWSVEAAMLHVGKKTSMAIEICKAKEKKGCEDLIKSLENIRAMAPFPEYIVLVHLAMLGIQRAKDIEKEDVFVQGLNIPEFPLDV